MRSEKYTTRISHHRRTTRQVAQPYSASVWTYAPLRSGHSEIYNGKRDHAITWESPLVSNVRFIRLLDFIWEKSICRAIRAIKDRLRNNNKKNGKVISILRVWWQHIVSPLMTHWRYNSAAWSPTRYTTAAQQATTVVTPAKYQHDPAIITHGSELMRKYRKRHNP